MADEEVTAGEGGITVEVAPDPDNKGTKTPLTDDEVEKLAELPGDDEVAKYAKDAQKRIKGLHLASQEWRRRVIQSNKDVATATSLAEQLYRENQELKSNAGRTEAALIEQAIQRAEAQLNQAKQRARAAYASQNPDEMVAANEEVARFAAEADRLRLLKPTAASPARPQGGAGPATEPGGGPAVTAPTVQMPPRVSAGVQNWLGKNTWFNRPGEEEMTGFAMGIHKSLEGQGITEESNPQQYWDTIDRRLREVYPHKFQQQQQPAADKDKDRNSGGTPVEVPASGGRPVTVAGSTRTNGGANGGAAGMTPRHIVLSESQVRIAKALGITPEQYATQLVKEAKERVQ